jgi:hypothetical protein
MRKLRLAPDELRGARKIEMRRANLTALPIASSLAMWLLIAHYASPISADDNHRREHG